MKLKNSFPKWVPGGSLGFTPVQSAKNYAQKANRKPPPEPKPQDKGRAEYIHYWTTRFKPRDRIPHPTFITPDHPTAPLHNLRARAHCLDHLYNRVFDHARKSWTSEQRAELGQKERATFDEIQKKRRIALKLYRALNESEIAVYAGALEKSLLERVHKRPDSPERSAGVTNELLEFLTPEMKASTWKVKELAEPYSDKNSEPSNPKGKMLMKNYLFPDWSGAIAFMRLALHAFKIHDHHPTTVMQYRPETNMAEIKICSWTHSPRKLKDPIEPSSAPLPDVSDKEFDDITQEVPQNQQTRLSDNPPIPRKTVPAEPTLTRKDFLLAWELDGVEIQSRLKHEEVERLRKVNAEKKLNATVVETETQPAVQAANSESEQKGAEDKKQTETAASQPSAIPVPKEGNRNRSRGKRSQQPKTDGETEVTILRPNAIKAVPVPNAPNASNSAAAPNERRKNPGSGQRRNREARAEKETKAKAEVVSVETPLVKLGEKFGDVAVVAGKLEETKPDQRQIDPVEQNAEPVEQKLEPVESKVEPAEKKLDSVKAELELPQANANTETVISKPEEKVSVPTPIAIQIASKTAKEFGEKSGDDDEKKEGNAETKA